MLFDVAGPVDSDIGNQNTDVTANLALSRRRVQTALKGRSIGGPHILVRVETSNNTESGRPAYLGS